MTSWLRGGPPAPPPWREVLGRAWPRLALDPDALARAIARFAPHVEGLVVPGAGVLADAEMHLDWIEEHRDFPMPHRRRASPYRTGVAPDIEAFIEHCNEAYGAGLDIASLQEALAEQQSGAESDITAWQLLAGPDPHDRFWFRDAGVPFLRVLSMSFSFDHLHLEDEWTGGALALGKIVMPRVDAVAAPPPRFDLDLDPALPALTGAALRIAQLLPLVDRAMPIHWVTSIAEVAAPELRHACLVLHARGLARWERLLVGPALVKMSRQHGGEVPDEYRARYRALTSQSWERDRLNRANHAARDL